MDFRARMKTSKAAQPIFGSLAVVDVTVFELIRLIIRTILQLKSRKMLLKLQSLRLVLCEYSQPSSALVS